MIPPYKVIRIESIRPAEGGRSMIKGRYVATLIIDLCVPDSEYKPETALVLLNTLRKTMRDEFTPELKELIENALGTQYLTVQVVQQLADVYEVPEEEEKNDELSR